MNGCNYPDEWHMPGIPTLRTLEERDISGLQANLRNMAMTCLEKNKKKK